MLENNKKRKFNKGIQEVEGNKLPFHKKIGHQSFHIDRENVTSSKLQPACLEVPNLRITTINSANKDDNNNIHKIT